MAGMTLGRDCISLILAAALGLWTVAPPALQAQSYPPPYSAPSQYPAAPSPANDQVQAYPAGQDTASDQQHGVARVSLTQGDVNVKRGDTGQLEAAAINVPLQARDHLETAPGSRAEVELDAANVIRMAADTDIGFADLEYHRYQVQVGIGTVILRVLRTSNAQVEVDTPSVALRPLSEGEYRISVFDNGTSQVTARSGRLEMSGPRGSQTVEPGRSMLLRGDASDPEFQTSYEIARDQFDDWSAGRDGELLSAQSPRYVSADISGTEDLDRNGSWVPSQYGQVWAPQLPAPDWSPYSSGHWVWENYYGWTWIDNAAWGWAPFHYGRWFWNGGHGWCWWPGASLNVALWSPALVGFFGWGAVGLGFAGLGWVALAPFEAIFSWWGHAGFGFGLGFRGGYGGYGYSARGDLGRMYRNAAIRGGAMTASYSGFGALNQRFNAANRMQLSNAGALRGQLPLSPTQASLRFTNRSAVSNPRLAAATNRQFFSSTGRNSMGGPTNGRQFGVQRPAVEGRSGGSTASTGWQRFGAPSGSSGVRQGFTAGGGESSGWHRFGQPQSMSPGYSGFTQSQRGYSNSTAPRYSAPAGQRYGGYAQSPAPRYSAPSQHYSAPKEQHYSAPKASSGGSHGGGGGSSHGGGGGHSSGGGGHRR